MAIKENKFYCQWIQDTRILHSKILDKIIAGILHTNKLVFWDSGVHIFAKDDLMLMNHSISFSYNYIRGYLLVELWFKEAFCVCVCILINFVKIQYS